MEKLETKISYLGGQAIFAKRLGVSQQLVSFWLRNKMRAEHVIHVEALTGISRHDLRPDIYPRDGGYDCPKSGKPKKGSHDG